MFETLFKTESAVQRYRTAPLARSRLDYLARLASQGARRSTLQRAARGRRTAGNPGSAGYPSTGPIRRRSSSRASRSTTSARQKSGCPQTGSAAATGTVMPDLYRI